MTTPIWTRRFFESTRGRIVQLLRRTSHTVDALAEALDLTDNAVRAQLTGLERDGLVRAQGLRRGGGKPSVLYEITPEVESALSRAYRPVLAALLQSLAAKLTERQLVELMVETGRRVAQELPPQQGDVGARAAGASAILNDLGGLSEAVRDSAGLEIRSDGCPLSAVVPEHPAVCKAVEALVSELTGTPVHEHCDRSGDRPRCRFELSGRPTAPPPSPRPRATS
jgi:DeoR family suf operon transcriptional repressor